MHPPVLNGQAAAPGVRDAHAKAAVFHRAGDARLGMRVVIRLDRLKRFDKRRRLIGDLPVGQNLAGADCVAVTDFPGGNADHFGQQVQVAFGRKAALRHTEAPKRPARRIVSVVSLAVDLDILIVVRPGRVRTCALEHRSAERRVRAGVRNERRLHRGEAAVFIAGRRKLHFKAVALWMDKDAFGARE